MILLGQLVDFEKLTFKSNESCINLNVGIKTKIKTKTESVKLIHLRCYWTEREITLFPKKLSELLLACLLFVFVIKKVM